MKMKRFNQSHEGQTFTILPDGESESATQCATVIANTKQDAKLENVDSKLTI